MTKQFNYVNLTCSDTFCTICINLVLVNYIDTGKIYAHEIVCPDCNTAIPDSIIDKNITVEQKQKILDLRVSL